MVVEPGRDGFKSLKSAQHLLMWEHHEGGRLTQSTTATKNAARTKQPANSEYI